MTASELLNTADRLRAALAAKPLATPRIAPRELLAYTRLVAEADRFVIAYSMGRLTFTAVIDLDAPELDLAPERIAGETQAAVSHAMSLRANAENAAR